MNEVEFTVVEKNGDLAIVWVIFKSGSDIGKYHKLRGAISLPYLFIKEELKGLDNGEGLELDETKLLMGLLLRYSSPIPPLARTSRVKPYLRPIVVSLLARFARDNNCSSIKDCLTKLAAGVKERHGESISSKLFDSEP